MLPETSPPLSAHDVRRLAVAAAVHPKTVSRAYRGESVRSTCAARIADAAHTLGIQQPPVRRTAEPTRAP
jgi:DNA-binding LacI/PurR family transcriptional regulator